MLVRAVGRDAEKFPISRDPPEGGTVLFQEGWRRFEGKFPISRDPPEGGTSTRRNRSFALKGVSNF